jgi:protein arginine kinase
MNIDALLSTTGTWLENEPPGGVIVSSRIRIARNLRYFPFPGWADVDSRVAVWDRLRAILRDTDAFRDGCIEPMTHISRLQRRLLFERHLVSREMMERGEGSGLAVKGDESASVMVNEEDHIRIQVLQPGLHLKALWKQADEIDNAIEQQTEYAFSGVLGYLTSCPTNVGTGMRASVMLHLPGLVLMQEMKPIINGLSKIGLAVRGLWGEGTEAAGHMFQVSNQMTLGEPEETIIHDLEQIVLEIVQHESHARMRLVEERNAVLQDHVGRAVGILSHACLITSGEALNLLSGLRLGSEMDILPGIDRRAIDELLMLTQPAHLQKMMSKSLKANERDEARADLIKRRLKHLK